MNKLDEAILDLYTISDIKKEVLAVAHQLVNDDQTTREDAACALIQISRCLSESEAMLYEVIENEKPPQ